MMGIYVAGIEIPKDKDIALLLCTDGSVGLYDVIAGKLHSCSNVDYKAIPVPPHGRLVDADALLDVWDDNHTIPSAAAKVIEKTIIPAEEDE